MKTLERERVIVSINSNENYKYIKNNINSYNFTHGKQKDFSVWAATNKHNNGRVSLIDFLSQNNKNSINIFKTHFTITLTAYAYYSGYGEVPNSKTFDNSTANINKSDKAGIPCFTVSSINNGSKANCYLDLYIGFMPTINYKE